MSFPVFEEQELLTSEKLNAFVQSLEDKFAAGITSVDLSWPLVAEGDLVMGTGPLGHSILGGKQILRVTNAAGYDTFQAAVSAAGAGGAVFIPPNTTITTQGVVLPNHFALFGAGPSSVLRVEGGAGYLLATLLGASDGLYIANLRLDGNDVPSQRGVLIRSHNGAVIRDVIFDRFDAEAVAMSPGSSTRNINVYIENCRFERGGDHHIEIGDVEGLSIRDCRFGETLDGSAIRGAAAASGFLKYVRVHSCVFEDNVGGPTISLEGRAGVSPDYGFVHVTDCSIEPGVIGAHFAVRLGTPTNPLKRVVFSQNTIRDADDAGGVQVSAEDLQLTGNDIQGTGTLGVDLGETSGGTVADNYISGFTTGIDLSDAEHVMWSDNHVICTTAAVFGAGPNYEGSNIGLPKIVRSTTNNEVTIPAHRIGPGDVVRASRTSRASAGGPGTMDMKVGGQTIASITNISLGDNARIDASLFVLTATSLRANVQVYKTSGWGQTTTLISGLDFSGPVVISSSNPGISSSFRHGLTVEYLGNNYEELP